MAKLVNTAQRITTGIVYPKADYSRVVMVERQVTVAGGSIGYAVTPLVAERTWLLGVDIWIWPAVLNSLVQCWVYVLTLTGPEPRSAAEMMAGELIFLSRGTYDGPFFFSGTDEHISLSMDVLYAGAPRRFGCLWQLAGGSADIFGAAAFRISEG